MTFQWSQTSLGVFYRGLTGRTLPAIELSDYRPMVLIGLGCVLAMLAGIRLASWRVNRPTPQPRPDFAFSFGPLIIAYVASVFVEGRAIPPNYPSLRQIIITSTRPVSGCSSSSCAGYAARRRAGARWRWSWASKWSWASPGSSRGSASRSCSPSSRCSKCSIAGTSSIGWRSRWRRRRRILGLVWMGIRGDYRAEYVEVDQFSNSRCERVQRVGLTPRSSRTNRPSCGGPLTRWSTECGPSTILRWRSPGPERPPHTRRDPERRPDTYRHAARIFSGQTRLRRTARRSGNTPTCASPGAKRTRVSRSGMRLRRTSISGSR